MSQPSNLKVKRLDELPLLPAGQEEEAFTYAVVNSTDYKLNAGVLAEAAADKIIDELADELAPVALSNSYNDLDDKPFIPQDSDDLPQGTTNLYATAAEKSKLAGIEAGAQVNTVTSVAGKTGAVTLTPSDTGAEPAFSKGSIIAGDGVHITGTLSNRLVGSGDITITATGEGGGIVVEVLAGEGIDVDSTDVASPVVSLADKAVTNAKMADMAASTIKGRLTGTGAPQDLTPAQVRTMLSIVDGADWNTNLINIPANISSWAGIDPSSKANSSVSISAGNGLTGGGTLAGNRTLTLGTPSTIGPSTTNSVTSSSHTHRLDLTAAYSWTGAHTFNQRVSFVDYADSSVDNASHILIHSGDGGWGIGLSSNSMNLVARGMRRLSVTNVGVTLDGQVDVNGTISDSYGPVRRTKHRTANGSGNLNAGLDLNGIIEKTNTSAVTYTIPAGLGEAGDIITIINSGSSGNITVARASGVSLYRNGTNANITVTPGQMISIVRTATANRWQA